MSKRYSFLLIIPALMFFGKAAAAQQTDTPQWTAKTAEKWVKSKEWTHRGGIKAHPSINPIEFAKQYHANKALWDKAIAFLNDKKLDTLKPGKYAIDGTDVYATITEGPSKEFAQSAWESHRNYIDLQYVVRGKEKIGVAPVSSAIVIKPYDETKDAANYNADGKYYVAAPDEFFLFFPGDAHRPNIKVEGYDTVKKLVIKIKYAPGLQ
jgi:YhcH/YjgK/YiaL family protein